MTFSEIRENFFSVLKKNDVPIFLQGSMSVEEKYPKLFITYFITEVSDQFADNKQIFSSANFDVAVYGKNISSVEELSETIKENFLKENFQFVIGGDVATDENDFFGFMQRFTKLF